MRISLYILRYFVYVWLLFPGAFLRGWGFEAHRLMNREAVKLLPGPVGSYFGQHIDFVSDHAIDPDLWKEDDPNEGHGHYIDADLYGIYPFIDIPRSLEALIGKYGADTVKKNGTAPWRINDYFSRLIDDFQHERWERATFTAAVFGHYVEDIHMPLHVVKNYDGQLSGNKGIHAQWETQMVDKFLLDKIHPKGDIEIIDDPLEEAFNIVADSYSYHRQLLRADSIARKGLSEEECIRLADWRDPMNDTDYHEILFRETGELAKARMEAAAVKVASYWYSAWIKGGAPEPPQIGYQVRSKE